MTMVRFLVSHRQIEKRTENAVCFDTGNEKVWIPLKKVNINKSEKPDFYEIVMPRWVFVKTNLPAYYPVEEFDFVTNF